MTCWGNILHVLGVGIGEAIVGTRHGILGGPHLGLRRGDLNLRSHGRRLVVVVVGGVGAYYVDRAGLAVVRPSVRGGIGVAEVNVRRIICDISVRNVSLGDVQRIGTGHVHFFKIVA